MTCPSFHAVDGNFFFSPFSMTVGLMATVWVTCLFGYQEKKLHQKYTTNKSTVLCTVYCVINVLEVGFKLQILVWCWDKEIKSENPGV